MSPEGGSDNPEELNDTQLYRRALRKEFDAREQVLKLGEASLEVRNAAEDELARLHEISASLANDLPGDEAARMLRSVTEEWSLPRDEDERTGEEYSAAVQKALEEEESRKQAVVDQVGNTEEEARRQAVLEDQRNAERIQRLKDERYRTGQ